MWMMAGGSSAGGALTGGLIAGPPGALVGAGVGAVAGTVAATKTGQRGVRLLPETIVGFQLDSPLHAQKIDGEIKGEIR